jgi:hypothetical protein
VKVEVLCNRMLAVEEAGSEVEVEALALAEV